MRDLITTGKEIVGKACGEAERPETGRIWMDSKRRRGNRRAIDWEAAEFGRKSQAWRYTLNTSCHLSLSLSSLALFSAECLFVALILSTDSERGVGKYIKKSLFCPYLYRVWIVWIQYTSFKLNTDS